MTVAERFLQLHHGEGILLTPNAWDAGSARVLEHLGFAALASTSSGAAAARGRLDGGLGREAALAHGAELAGAVGIPVSADLENCFADAPDGVAETIGLAAQTGLAGASVEDWGGEGIYDRGLARERVAAAVEAAAGRLVITARAENLIHGVDDLDDTIARLISYQEAGADVLFAPGVRSEEQIRALIGSVSAPVNVLVLPGVPAVPVLAELGVRRVSTGGGLAFSAYAGLAAAARELAGAGTYSYLDGAGRGRALADRAFA